MTTEYSKAYAKGYQAGMKRSWPQHRAPLPPDKIREDIMKAANDLRDAADDICARLDESDDFVKELSPKIDALDKANRALVDWCVSPPEMANTADEPRGKARPHSP